MMHTNKQMYLGQDLSGTISRRCILVDLNREHVGRVQYISHTKRRGGIRAAPKRL